MCTQRLSIFHFTVAYAVVVNFDQVHYEAAQCMWVLKYGDKYILYDQ